MSTNPTFITRRLSSFLGALALLLAADAAITACSTTNPAQASACSALSACCAAMPSQTAGACQADLQAAQTTGASCAQLLQSYESGGYCGGASDASVPANVGDAAAFPPCLLTGTCDAGSSTSTSTGDPTPQCETLGSCSDGETVSTCVQTLAGGVCSATIVLSGGSQFTCASCTDCAAATANAQLICHPSTPSEDAGTTSEDAGPSCGTAPVLHPETTPGVYCPFTAAGAVHCTAGQQCCEAPSGNASSCEAAGTTCPVTGSVAWECADPLDCQGSAGGSVCCATGTTTYDAVCAYDRGVGFTGSVCATSCGAGQVQICSAANDPCVAPAACTPFKVDGLVMGTCL